MLMLLQRLSSMLENNSGNVRKILRYRRNRSWFCFFCVTSFPLFRYPFHSCWNNLWRTAQLCMSRFIASTCNFAFFLCPFLQLPWVPRGDNSPREQCLQLISSNSWLFWINWSKARGGDPLVQCQSHCCTLLYWIGLPACKFPFSFR